MRAREFLRRSKKRRKMAEVDTGLDTGLTWRQYPCTKDCSGHQAGDNWAQARGITNPAMCPPGNSNSWWEGCKSEAEKQPY
jgi:hypothetical protein